jgi:ABC-type transporter Mla subunit MlaD
MPTSTKQEEQQEHLTMEERLSAIGAHIDDLIAKANEAKARLASNLEQKKEVDDEALDELKESLHKAWCNVDQAWEKAKAGVLKAAKTLCHPPNDSK